jgi:DTW domain-containing protein YfiP
VPQRSRARLVLLQHAREARNPLGTARMAHLSVPGSLLRVGIDFNADAELRALAASGSAVVLYPSDGARDARELSQRPDPLTIFVVDGTWWQAHKIFQVNPWLRDLPAYRLAPERPSHYHQIRSEPEPHCLSTIEAVAALLDAVDGVAGSHAGMLQPLESLVGRQLGHSAGEKRDPRRRLRTRPPRGFKLPEALSADPSRALLFHAEGNGYPASQVGAPPVELAHWLALRPATGERFHALVRPSAPLSPTFRSNTRLGEPELAQMIDAAEFRRRWSEFVRPDDLWCGWGHFAAGLLARAGSPPALYLDLQKNCAALLRQKAGGIERAFATMQLPPIQARSPGRGGQRIEMLGAIFGAMLEAAR